MRRVRSTRRLSSRTLRGLMLGEEMQDQAPRPVAVRYAIARPPFFEGPVRTISTMLAALTVVLVMDARGVEALMEAGETLYIVSGGLLLVLAMVAHRLVTWPRGDLALELGPSALVMPRSVSSRRTITVPYEEIRDLEVRGGAATGLLLVDTQHGLRLLPLARFRDATAAANLTRAICERILVRPGGRAQLEQLAARRLHADALVSRRARVTLVMLALITAVFLLELRTGALSEVGSLGLLQLGASSPGLVRAGEVWRLFTANLLHGGFLHLIMNGFALLSLGGLLERWLGSARYTFVLLVSSVGGALASALAARAIFSVGISTGLFGLLGALAVIHLRHRAVLPAGFRQSRLWWIVILGLNFSLPLLVPVIDGTGHAGGFVTGFLATWFVDRGLGASTPASERVSRALAIVSAGAFAIAVGIGLAHGTSERATSRDLVTLARSLVARPLDGPGDTEALNAVAWTLVISRETPPSAWPIVRELADRAVRFAPPEARPDYIDTRATVAYRMGRADPRAYDDAVTLELQALAAAHRSEGLPAAWRVRQQRAYGTQLARFLDARVAVSGPIVIDADPRTVEVRLTGEGVSATHRVAGEVLVHAVVLSGGTIAGLIEVCARPAGATSTVEPVELALAPGGTEPLLRSQLVVARVDGRADACRVSRAVRTPLVAADDELVGYP
jgi:rhomboid protease GluP